MGFTVFQKPERRETIPGLRQGLAQSVSQGISEGIEQDALDRLLNTIKTSDVDPLTAILGSNLSPERQKVVAGLFQQREQADLKRQSEAFKQISEARKLQEQEQNLAATRNFIQEQSGGKISAESLQGVPQATLNSVSSNLTKPRDVLSPQEKAFDKLQEGIINKVPTLEQNISDSNRALELAQKENVGINFQGGNLTDKFRSALRFLNVKNIPLTADEAQLSNLVLRRADELKRKFGSRITNFDFEKWLEGQPATNKFRNANIALATMQRKEAEVDRAKFDAWQDIVSNPSISPDQRTNALLMSEREILQKADEELSQELNAISNIPQQDTTQTETLEQIRNRQNTSPKVDKILQSASNEQSRQRIRAQIAAQKKKRNL